MCEKFINLKPRLCYFLLLNVDNKIITHFVANYIATNYNKEKNCDNFVFLIIIYHSI